MVSSDAHHGDATLKAPLYSVLLIYFSNLQASQDNGGEARLARRRYMTRSKRKPN